MYFPILRGRQFELLALRECVTEGLISKEILPVLEPVRASSTLVKTIEEFINADREIAFIFNPQVGSFEKEIKKDSNLPVEEALDALHRDNHIVPTLYVDRNLKKDLLDLKARGDSLENAILIFSNPEYIDSYEEYVEASPRFVFIPDKGEFRRRIRFSRVLCEDHFPRRQRNVDYLDIEPEFFSSDHLYYREDGYKGFSDYSVIGSDYSETGFAPYAIAIHIVFFDNRKTLKIAHFVSETNDDISDPARKFAEAAEKLVQWNNDAKLDTAGIRALISAYEEQTYPGLGVLKKYSIMHHLELMSKYLDGEIS